MLDLTTVITKQEKSPVKPIKKKTENVTQVEVKPKFESLPEPMFKTVSPINTVAEAIPA